MNEFCVGIKRNALFYSFLPMFAGVLLIAAVYSDGLIPEDIHFIVFGLLGIVLGPLIYINLYVSKNTPYKKNYTRYTSMYSKDAIEADFEKGRYFVHGCINAGESFVFGKGTGQFIAYNDIELIRLHRLDTFSSANGSAHQDWFIEAKVYSEYKRLCKLKRYPGNEWKEFVEYIDFIAPNIYIEDKIKFSADQETRAETPPRIC